MEADIHSQLQPPPQMSIPIFDAISIHCKCDPSADKETNSDFCAP